MKNFKKGFTLIELLVVVAIIGILASVVLASLNSARTKGTDAAIKANLANTRAQAEIVYDSRLVSPNTYTGVCKNGVIDGTNETVQGIGSGVQAASTAAGTSTIVINSTSAQISTDAHCNSTATAWAAEVKLKGNTTDYLCVDSTGASLVTTKPLAAYNATTPTGVSCQ